LRALRPSPAQTPAPARETGTAYWDNQADERAARRLRAVVRPPTPRNMRPRTQATYWDNQAVERAARRLREPKEEIATPARPRASRLAEDRVAIAYPALTATF